MSWLRSLAAGLTLAAAGLLFPAQAAEAPLRVYGNMTTIEFASVLLAADRFDKNVMVTHGGIPDLFVPGKAEVATNAETQSLRVSLDHPDLRIILTTSEGFYRIVGRRSSGIAKLADLKGKRIATFPNTSSAFYLQKMLNRVGLTEADVTIVPMTQVEKMPAALASRTVDAVTIWEPEIETAKVAIGADAIDFQDRKVYRELFSLHAKAGDLADPAKRRQIVTFVRAIVDASAALKKDPARAQELAAAATKYDRALVAKVWEHEGYPAALVPDLLDVLVEEDVWVAKERGRAPRSRAELARLIDDSVVREAMAGR
jgi:NitT/TauT family transport system substrate-binding protein